jgi:hypothetical protein
LLRESDAVELEKRDGTTIQVPRQKLSEEDLSWIKDRGWNSPPEHSDSRELEKVNSCCLFLLESAAEKEAKAQATLWLTHTRVQRWGETTGRYLMMGQDKVAGWWVRLQSDKGDTVTIRYKDLDAKSQERLKEMWNLKFYIPRNANKLQAEAPQK